MKKRVAINGFGRIGRLAARNLIHHPKLELVAVNDLTDIQTLAHLFQYDTAHRKYQGSVHIEGEDILIDGKQIKAFANADTQALPWKVLGIDIVLECTGVFLTRDKCKLHLDAGAKRVIISAPAKEDDIPTYVLGVNEKELSSDIEIMSNASCTTNCLAPILKLIHTNFGIINANMNTIHAYTQDQRLQDAPHKDLRRARAAGMNIIPTTTGAAKAVERVYPQIKGKLMASSYRVPVITGSLIELYCTVSQEVNVDKVNQCFHNASRADLKGILEYSIDPLVSTDIIDNIHSSVFDSSLTEASGNQMKIVAWYDNEAGYAARLTDICELLGSKL